MEFVVILSGFIGHALVVALYLEVRRGHREARERAEGKET
jgi:hypothetical protein